MYTNKKGVNVHKIEFRYGTSRGRDSYGYNIITLYVDGVKTSQMIGSGFDMHGACIGVWLTKEYKERLIKLTANYGSFDDNKGFYGLVHYNKGSAQRVKKAKKDHTETYVDGACGISSVHSIAEKIKVDWFESK